MAKLILVRHGETEKNVNLKIHSPDDKESLNETGKEQIKKVADRLMNLSPSKIYSSKEKRAIESSRILSEQLSIPLETIDGMQERNWGVFAGKSWREIRQVLDRMSLDERYKYVPENGESWKEFEERLVKAVEAIKSHPGGVIRTVVIVTHGGAIRALIPYLLKIPREESFKYNPDNASISVFDYDGKNFSEVVINDVSHLGR